jgi:hypothetical protein
MVLAKERSAHEGKKENISKNNPLESLRTWVFIHKRKKMNNIFLLVVPEIKKPGKITLAGFFKELLFFFLLSLC